MGGNTCEWTDELLEDAVMAGDRIVSVNDIPGPVELLQELKTSTRLNVNLIRPSRIPAECLHCQACERPVEGLDVRAARFFGGPFAQGHHAIGRPLIRLPQTVCCTSTCT